MLFMMIKATFMVETGGFWTLNGMAWSVHATPRAAGRPWTIDEHDTSQCIGRGVGF